MTIRPKARLLRVELALALVSGLLIVLTANTASAVKGCATIKGPPPIGQSNVLVSGATVTTPGRPGRALDANQATAFVQTWLPWSILNTAQDPPPPQLPVSVLNIRTNQGALAIWYATDAKNVWIGAPALPSAHRKNNQSWVRVPEPAKTTAGFNGTLDPVCPAPPPPSTTTTTGTTNGQASASHGGSSSGSWLPYVLVVGGVVVVGGGAWLTGRRRRRARAAAD